MEKNKAVTALEMVSLASTIANTFLPTLGQIVVRLKATDGNEISLDEAITIAKGKAGKLVSNADEYDATHPAESADPDPKG